MPLKKLDKKIFLVPVDGSAHSELALEHAIALMNKETDELVILTVIHTSLFTSDSAKQQHITEAEATVKKCVEKAKESKVHKIQTISQESSDVKEEICRQAKFTAADYLVIGSRGMSAVARVVLGSNAEYVLNHSPCPTLVTRTKD